jgi:hypothetical protein
MSKFSQPRHHLWRALLLAAVALPAARAEQYEPAAPAAVEQATAAAQAIEVTAPRADVRTVCRSVDERLQEMLGYVAWREGAAGEVDVRFQIEGRRVVGLRTTGRPVPYRVATHRAVRSLECSDAGAGRRSVRMKVVFLDAETSAERERAASRSQPLPSQQPAIVTRSR